MNWTLEPWFTNLPADTQQDLIDQYESGGLSDNNISSLKAMYTPQQKPVMKPLNAFGKAVFNPLEASAKAAANGGNIFNVMGAHAKSLGGEIKEMSSGGIITVLKPFFNCFESKLFAPYEKSYGHALALYAFCNHILLSNDPGSINLNKPNIVNLLPEIVQSQFDDYAPKIAEIIWTDGLATGLFSTIAEAYRNIVFYTTDKILEMINLQTFNILVPSIKQLGTGKFNVDYIINALGTFNLSKLGITNNGGVLTTNIEVLREKLPLLEEQLRQGIMSMRDECIINMKQNIKTKFDDTVKEATELLGMKENPAMTTLNNQIKPQTSLQTQTSNPSQYSTTTAGTSGFGGLGDGSDAKAKYDQIMGQASSKYGLDMSKMSNMGFGPDKEISWGEKLGLPKDQWDKVNKFQQEYQSSQQQQQKSNPLKDIEDVARK